MSTLPVQVPNTFQTQTGNIALSQLDNNFTTIYTTVNTIGNGTTSLSNVSITGGNSTFTIANIANANLNVASISNATITNGNATLTIANIGNANINTANISNVTVSNVSLVNGSLNNVVIGNVTPVNGSFTNVVATGGFLDNVVIGNTTTANGSFTYITANANIAPSVNIGAISYGSLSYADTNHWQVMSANVNSYAQFVLQNKSGSNQASTDIVLASGATNATSYYLNLGLNSPNYGVTGNASPFNSGNSGYLFTANAANLSIGTTDGNAYVKIVANNLPVYFANLITTNATSTAYLQQASLNIQSPANSALATYWISNGSYAALISASTTNFNIIAGNRLSIGAGYNYANSIPQSPTEAIGISNVGTAITLFGSGSDGNVPLTVNGAVRLAGPGGGGASYQYYGSNSDAYLYVGPFGSTRNYQWYCNSIVSLTIGNTGNVGVGLANANTIFHIANTSAGAVTQTIQNNTANATIDLTLSNLTITSPGLTTINSTGNVLVSSAAATVNASGNVLVQGTNTTHSANGTFTVNSSGNVLVSSAANITISSASAFTINANANISIRANTGVGLGNIASPATLLHIGNTSLGNVAQTIQNNTANALIYLNLANLTITSPGITTVSSTGNVVIQGTNTTISANGTMTINANANISIIANSAIGLGNIASPATLLHIGNTSAQNVVVTIQDNTANGTIGLYNANLQIKTANTSGYIIFANSSANTVSLSNTAQLLVVGAGGAIGYGTGAGGNITQGTSKSTGVTLNTGAGQITMNNAALASNTSITFLLTNSVIAAADNMIVSVVSGAATVGSYTTQVSTIAAGSANITVRNITAGSLSEAIVLSFTVLKGATA